MAAQQCLIPLWAMNTPDTPESISKEWLTDSLGIDQLRPGAEVTSFRIRAVGGETGWVGTIARIDISWSSNVEGAPDSVIIKISPTGTGDPFGSFEGFFYDTIARGRNFSVPGCYFAFNDLAVGRSVLLLEDLSHLATVDFVQGCTPDEARSAIFALADIHAAWWNDQSIASMQGLVSFATSRFESWWASYERSIRELLPDVELSKRMMEFGDVFASDPLGVAHRIESSPTTIVHRDVHVDNLLFDRTGTSPRAVIVDWQTVGAAIGVSDVAYLLISSLSPSDRLLSERRLVEAYHSRLMDLGIKGYEFERCWDDYVISVASKLFITVAATTKLDNNTPRRRAWRTKDLERLAAFFRDHDPVSHL